MINIYLFICCSFWLIIVSHSITAQIPMSTLYLLYLLVQLW